MKQLPQIDASFQHDKSPDFAGDLLDDLLESLSLDQISVHTGICRRSLSYMRHKGIRVYPYQLALEVLAGRKVIAE